MKLTLEQVRHVAQLARLQLSPEEEQRYQGQLSAILDAVDQLGALDVSQVEPTSHARVRRGDPARGTRCSLRCRRRRRSANAPAKVGTSFAVPKILE